MNYIEKIYEIERKVILNEIEYYKIIMKELEK